MIRINLLPQQYRGRERLSVKVWATLLTTVVIVCCAIGYFAHVYLAEYKVTESERISREDKLTQLEPLAKYDDDLVAEKQEYLKRAQTIQSIANSRALWTRLLDLFIDIVNNEGNMDRHHAWFTNLSIAGGDAKTGPTWSLNTFVQSESFIKQANLLDDIEGNKEFFQDFTKITPPGGKVVRHEDKYPQEAVSFKLEMRMHAPGNWARNKPNAGKQR